MTRFFCPLLCFAIAVLGAQSPAAQDVAIDRHARIDDVRIIRPNIVVRGRYLSRVEIGYWSTGTGITGTKPADFGEARRSSSPGARETWIFHIPDTQVLAVEIFARAFDRNGKLVGTKAVPIIGVGSLYEALYGVK